MSTTSARTARTPHECDSCYWTPSLRGVPTILPGHRYLRHVGFPGDEGVSGERPWVLRECADHAISRDDSTATDHGICGSYCHGTNPCALPFEKGAPGHDHVCRECMTENSR